MTICLKELSLRQVQITTRMPFRYGIATLTDVPHVLVFGKFEVDRKLVQGIAADVLPPKWFTKQKDASLEDEISEMLLVIRRSCKWAIEVADQEDVFHWQQAVYHRQMDDLVLAELPPLLKNFGVSLLERSAIDATCRRHSLNFHRVVRENLLGIRLGELHPELIEKAPSDFLDANPRQTMAVRHTIGLADPITDEDIPPAAKLHDGLPQSLESCIRRYRISHFKIKVPKAADEAIERIRSIEHVVSGICKEFYFTLDGNEFYEEPAEFREFWRRLSLDSRVTAFVNAGLLVVEQPFHREIAFSDDVKRTLEQWDHRPPIIIDESDGDMLSLRQALEVGYQGTSLKNCKGIIKGIANVCLLKQLNSQSGTETLFYTGEDLMNLGPVALLQDLAVGASVGLTHMERNGHHYVAGLRHMPDKVQYDVQQVHADLFHEHQSTNGSFVSLTIRDGLLDLTSTNRSPFGYGIDLSQNNFTPLSID